MNVETNIKLIEQIFKNVDLFTQEDSIFDFSIIKCEDYDDESLYLSKKLDNKIESNKYIDNLSKINIRETLFESYFEILKIKDLTENSWIEKTIYNKEDYNIQIFKRNNNNIKCYSDLNLDDNTFNYNWINNPYTCIKFDENNNLVLNIAFEINNGNQDELLIRFLKCLNKLEIALISN